MESGKTPINAEEISQLIPGLATQQELNEFEALNIELARKWALKPNVLKHTNPFLEGHLREVHRRMFNETWKWAGIYRTTKKTIGCSVGQIQNQIGALLGDSKYWVSQKTFSIDEVAIRFHHRLVSIHPFPNGNGRHSRLMADIIIAQNSGRPFSWGGDTLRRGEVRERYLKALRKADAGDIGPLLEFARL